MEPSGKDDGAKRGVLCVKLPSDQSLYYIDEDTVLKNVKERGYGDDLSLKQVAHSDLTPGVYEGGFKVWECCIDLCEYIDHFLEWQVLRDKRVLELGCGAGLPSILALHKGAREVTLQDYNNAVIDCFTKDNFVANSMSMENCHFYACDWPTLQQKLHGQKFDVILTSETIYNDANYGPLHDLIDDVLITDGLVLLASKLFYFGIGGNVPSFLDYVKARGVFDTYTSWTAETDIPRKIIQITRKCSS